MAVWCDSNIRKMARGRHTLDEGLAVSGMWWSIEEILSKQPLEMGYTPCGAPNPDFVKRKTMTNDGDDCRR